MLSFAQQSHKTKRKQSSVRKRDWRHV